MVINIIAFGQIAEITGKEFLSNAIDLNALKLNLVDQFPILAERKFAIAVNQKLVNENCVFKKNDTVALMPPYSGG